MTINLYDLGDLVRVTGTFRNAAGTLIDPTTVGFEFRKPDGTITSYVYPATIVKDSTGIYHVDINANASGSWRYRWESTGTGQAAEEGSFVVEASAFS